MKLCFATNNKNKLKELKQAVDTSIQIVSLEEIECFDEIPETGTTLAFLGGCLLSHLFPPELCCGFCASSPTI